MLDATPHTIANPDDSPIFIIGTGRSGTTLLRQMLNAHPRIHITHEASFYSYARHAPAHASASDWLERYFETFSFAWLRLDPQRIRDALPQPLPMARLDQVCRAVMRCKAQQRGKPRYGDKNPLDTQNLGRIFADFADPRVVYITRDPRPTVLSFKRMPFGTSSFLINSLICRIQFAHIQPYLDRILEVRLEDLVADSRTSMQAILGHLGEPFDEAVLDHVNQSATDDVPPLPWFIGATREQPNQKTSGGGWREGMDPAWIRLVEWLNRDSMRRYGYAPAELAREPSRFALLRALCRDVPEIATASFRLLAFNRKLDRHFQDKQRLDAQQGMEENVSLNPAAWRHYPHFQMPEVPQIAQSPPLP